MPNLASFHPQIVHFVVGLLIVGVIMRILGIPGRPKFLSPAAATLIILGTIAAWFAVKSGVDAHGPVERIPGARELVEHHEEQAILARNIFFVVSAIELIAFAMTRKESLLRYVRLVYGASALVGLFGLMTLYEAAEHGGEIVYSYGGGPGIRTGDPKDVERLLLAGLYNQSQADRRAGLHTQAAELVQTMARRNPVDPEVQLLLAESLLLDSKRAAEALEVANGVMPEPANARLVARRATLRADIYLAMGAPDMAKRTLSDAIAALPTGATQANRLKTKLDSIK